MMDDGSDVAPTELDTESDDTSSGEDGPFYDDDGVYIDRLRAFRMLHTHREISASGTNIHFVWKTRRGVVVTSCSTARTRLMM